MASLSNAWDLQASAAPRSICIFKAPQAPQQRNNNQGYNNNSGNNHFEQRKNINTSTNPFDTAVQALAPSKSGRNNNEQDTAQYAVIFGTEEGALHYRTYPYGSLGFGDVSGRRMGANAAGLSKISPLGQDYNPSSLRNSSVSNSSTPSVHQPIDLPNAVPGAIVGILKIADDFTHNNNLSFETFLLLVDDNRGSAPSSSSSPGTYATQLISLKLHKYSSMSSYAPKLNNTNTFSKLNMNLPRMSAAAFHPNCGYVYAAGTSIMSVGSSIMNEIFISSSPSGYARPQQSQIHPAFVKMNSIIYKRTNVLPSNVRAGGNDALALVCQGYVAVVSVNNSFYAVAAASSPISYNKEDDTKKNYDSNISDSAMKLFSLNQSSVHPVVILEVKTNQPVAQKVPANIISSLVFVASGRECSLIEINYSITPPSTSNISLITSTSARHGIITFPSPILAATSTLLPSSRVRTNKGASTKAQKPLHNENQNRANASVSLLAILTADGTTHIRSPSCMGVPLCVLDVGNRPNNFFTLENFPKEETLEDTITTRGTKLNKTALMAVGYSGDARIITCREDSSQVSAGSLPVYSFLPRHISLKNVLTFFLFIYTCRNKPIVS